MRTFVIGDIHGCYRELMLLLDKAAPGGEDRIVALGDIVDRGPDTPRVLKFFRETPNAMSLKGNHERKHVRWYNGLTKPGLSQVVSRWQIGEERYPEEIEFMSAFPHYLDTAGALLLHGFFEPGVPLTGQKEDILLGVMSGEAYMERTYGVPWYELYDGGKPVVAGHLNYTKSRAPLVYRDTVFGLDTDCCHGGALTGMFIDDFTIISVPSGKAYWAEVKKFYMHNNGLEHDLSLLTWKELDALARENKEDPEAKEYEIRRAAEAEKILKEIEQVLEAIRRHVESAYMEIIETLRAEMPWDVLSSPEQAAIFNERQGKSPFIKLLHRRRKGELAADDVKAVYSSPARAIKAAGDAGLNHIK